MRTYLLLLAVAVSLPTFAAPPECRLNNFPDFWADAQDRVEKLNIALKKLETEKNFSKSTEKQFRQSVKLCESKRKAIWAGGSGNGGVVPQMKCEAILICSRIEAIEMEF